MAVHSLWTAESSAVTVTGRPLQRERVRAAVRATVSSIGSLVLLTGFAVFLIRLAGWPLPDHWPDRSEWLHVAEHPLDGPLLRDVGACAGWAFLALLTFAIGVEAFSRLTRRRLPRIRLPRPIRALAAGIVGASIIGLITAPANAAPQQSRGLPVAPPAAVATAPAHTAPTTTTRLGGATATFVVSGHRYHVIVRRGDTMSRIARQWLGDADRWPEICHLNNHRHFAKVGGTLHDCDLIYPRWDLKLPAGARPPAGAVQLRPATPAPVTPPVQAPPSPTKPSPTTTANPSPATTSPTPSADMTLPPDPESVVTSDSPSPAPTTPTRTLRPTQPSNSTAATSAHQQSADDDTWLTIALAAALLAVATMVLRRRRHTQHRATAPATSRRRRDKRLRHNGNAAAGSLPHLITLARQFVHKRQTDTAGDVATTADALEPAAQVPEPDADTPAPAGIGLIGPGAAAAARAAMVEILAHADDGALHGRVITTQATLDELLDGPQDTVPGWPYLHVAESHADAVDQLHQAILRQRRTLDTEGALPSEGAGLPPIRLILTAPDADLSGRLTALLSVGTDLAVTARILGDWPPTVTVTVDGTATGVDVIGCRLPVLSVADTLDAFALVREAATGTPDPAPAAPSAHAAPADGPSADTAPGQKATLRVLGPLHIGPDRTGTRPHLRDKAKELAVYLACRADGADVATISEVLFPDSTVDNSKASVQQAVSSLRKVLQFHARRTDNPVQLIGGDRYRLNPDVVAVDLWQLFDLTRAAAAATDPGHRHTLLHDATALGTGRLGVGMDTDWIDAYRVTATVTAVEVHLRLAEQVAATDPHRASDLLADAIDLDPTNEGLYRRRMRLLATLDATDQVPALLRDLTRVLADIDAEPEPETTALAQTLLQHKRGGPHPARATAAPQQASSHSNGPRLASPAPPGGRQR